MDENNLINEFNNLLKKYGIENNKNVKHINNINNKKINKHNKHHNCDNNRLKKLEKNLKSLKRSFDRTKKCLSTSYILFDNDKVVKVNIIGDQNEIVFINKMRSGFRLRHLEGRLKFQGGLFDDIELVGKMQIYNFDNNQLYNGIIKSTKVRRHNRTKQKIYYYLANEPKFPLNKKFDAMIIIRIFLY